MPTRILRDWTDSEVINSLSAEAERFFVRLLMKADDYGRFTANPKLIKASLFPLLIDSIREADISRWTAEAAKAGLIALYEMDSKKFLVIPKFNQRMRNSKPKFPSPPELLLADNPPQVAASCGELRPESESETESETKAHKRAASPPDLLPDALDSPEFAEAWRTYEEHRREKRKPLTATGRRALLKKLAGWGRKRAIAAIEHSIANGWQGVFEPPGSDAGDDDSAIPTDRPATAEDAAVCFGEAVE